ncbi:MAG: hypothetical protein ACNS63_12505 [Candidatus Nitrospinota bacterium M3_3B_026]
MSGGYADDRARKGEKETTTEEVQKDLEKAARELFGAPAEEPEEAAAPEPAEKTMDISAGEELTEDFFTKTEPVAHPKLYETAGYIADEFDYYGEVIDGGDSQRVSFSYPDVVYIDKGSDHGVREGDRFFVGHAESEEVEHPVTGEVMGRKILMDGVIKVVETTPDVSKAVITSSFDVIERGDKILPYREPQPPAVDPDKPVTDKDIEGYIVESRREKSHYGMGDIVYFDVGEESGVAPGDVFDILDTSEVVRRGGEIVKGLPKVIGRARILSARSGVSTAYIFTSENVIVAGDVVTFTPVR